MFQIKYTSFLKYLQTYFRIFLRFENLYSIYRFLLSFHNKDPPNDIYCITEKPSKHYFTEKFHTLVNDANDGIISTPRIKMARIRILLFFVFSSKRASSICPTINQVFQKLPVLCLNFLFFHIISRLFSVHCDVMNHCLSTL